MVNVYARHPPVHRDLFLNLNDSFMLVTTPTRAKNDQKIAGQARNDRKYIAVCHSGLEPESIAMPLIRFLTCYACLPDL